MKLIHASEVWDLAAAYLHVQNERYYQHTGNPNLYRMVLIGSNPEKEQALARGALAREGASAAEILDAYTGDLQERLLPVFEGAGIPL